MKVLGPFDGRWGLFHGVCPFVVRLAFRVGGHAASRLDLVFCQWLIRVYGCAAMQCRGDRRVVVVVMIAATAGADDNGRLVE